jgi:hypothetical protein
VIKWCCGLRLPISAGLWAHCREGRRAIQEIEVEQPDEGYRVAGRGRLA